MKSLKLSILRPAKAYLAALMCVIAGSWAASAQSVQHLSVIKPGGMPGTNIITGVTLQTNGLVVTWDGPSGYCLLYGKVGTGPWQLLGPKYNTSRVAVINPKYSNATFKVVGPSTRYASATGCIECHPKISKSQSKTAHAGAFKSPAFVASHGTTNAACLACHTVGYKMPTGFVSAARTPKLAGVQCENCHGPAANHAANPANRIVKPRAEVASEVCGGCHSTSHNPVYNEWSGSAHAVVVEDMNPTNRISACGRCHSGSARVNLLAGKPLPKGDANMAIECVVCHDPHQTNANPFQLRNPLQSSRDYALSTSDVFTNKYDPNINLCAQCHNHRGADWTSTTRPPHHSPQYNMVLGTVGLLDSGSSIAPHAAITNQCVECHMRKSAYVSESQPAVTGHSFKAPKDVCVECHGFGGFGTFVQGAITNRIEDIQFALNFWATNNAPAALSTNYGIRSWEYTSPGELSTGGSGPASAEQALIPDNIKKARFNLYLVLHDGSLGIHNPPYAAALLDSAEAFVEKEVYK